MQLNPGKNKAAACVLFLTLIVSPGLIFAQDAVIKVYPERVLGQVNRKVFGSSFTGTDPVLRKKPHLTNYGVGVWNPKEGTSVKEVIDMAKEAGLGSFRFITNNFYEWKKAVGKKRKYFLYGIDEFLKTTEEIGAEPIFTISYHTVNVQDAADFVEYLNAPCDGNYVWATERANNGRPEPYNVKYFELGNEIFSPKNNISPEEYADSYLQYSRAMKAIDPSIELGVVLGPSLWNRRVMEIIRNKIDFGVIHIYPRRFQSMTDKRVEKYPPSEIFKVPLALAIVQHENEIKQMGKLLEEKSGKKIPIAVTEHNVGLAQSRPVSYRRTLGAALVNAELLRIFMKPENRILLANYHSFLGWWGMIKLRDNYVEHNYTKPIRYTRRPSYYVYELYRKYFGKILIGAEVRSNSYDFSTNDNFVKKVISRLNSGNTIGTNLLSGEWKIRELSGVYAQEKQGVLEINFNNPADYSYFHAVKRANIEPDTYYRLSGYVKTENLVDTKGVSLMLGDGRGYRRTRSVAETERIVGSNDWQHVHIIYRTLPDADSVAVMVRRMGGDPFKGKVYVKDVTLEKIDPDTRIPYLSVNASKGDNGEIYLMVINKNMHNSVRSSVELANYEPIDRADTWILKGSSVSSTNEKSSNKVKIRHKKIKIKANPFYLTFSPHSLTAIKIGKKETEM